MRIILPVFFLIFSLVNKASAQNTIPDTITFDGLRRACIIYVPPIYNPSVPTPLVVNIHGYSSNPGEQYFYSGLSSVADTANFIIIYPEGTPSPVTGLLVFNSGFGGTVNDVGYINALIDTVRGRYNIDDDRIYSTGMSNGGFMSHVLACERSDRFAAIASVTGSMTRAYRSSCNPANAVPVLQIHGTADGTVPYLGTTGVGSFMPVETLVADWATRNGCGPSANGFVAQPNTNLTDGTTWERMDYQQGRGGAETILYKINNGGHTWPGAAFTIGVTSQDFNASVEIWRFFRKYRRSVLNSIEQVQGATKAFVWPNPSIDGTLNFQSAQSWEEITISNQLGQIVSKQSNVPQYGSVDVSRIGAGMYFITFRSVDGTSFTSKWIKQ